MKVTVSKEHDDEVLAEVEKGAVRMEISMRFSDRRNIRRIDALDLERGEFVPLSRLDHPLPLEVVEWYTIMDLARDAYLGETI